MMITQDIYQVGGPGLTAGEDAAIYLIVDNGQAALVDAGCGNQNQRLLGNIEACGIDPQAVQLVLLTHCHFDHTGGAEALRLRLGCQIVAHELDVPYLEAGDDEVTAASWYGESLLPFQIDCKLAGARQEIVLGRKTITAIHMPGHSPGSVAYLIEAGGLKVVFGQDVHGPLDRRLLSNRRDYQNSLKRLMDLEADILCEGHFGIFKGKNEVRRFIASYMA